MGSAAPVAPPARAPGPHLVGANVAHVGALEQVAAVRLDAAVGEQGLQGLVGGEGLVLQGGPELNKEAAHGLEKIQHHRVTCGSAGGRPVGWVGGGAGGATGQMLCCSIFHGMRCLGGCPGALPRSQPGLLLRIRCPCGKLSVTARRPRTHHEERAAADVPPQVAGRERQRQLKAPFNPAAQDGLWAGKRGRGASTQRVTCQDRRQACSRRTLNCVR